MPTPIITEDLNKREGFALSPAVLSCSYVSDTRLLFRRMMITKTEERHLDFVLEPSGLLRHNCTGKLVCPDAFGEVLIVSASCDPQNAKFERTAVSML